MAIEIKGWTAYADASGVNALVVVDGQPFACWFTSAVKVQPVSSHKSPRRVSRRALALADWAFRRELEARTTPEYRAAVLQVYSS